MSFINIGKSNDTDRFYRYKMPALAIKMESGKTKIANITDVATSLSREASEIMKFLSCELGTNMKDNILFGRFTVPQLSHLLSTYINTFVLCPTCENPETKYTIVKKRLCLTCQACGSSNKLSSDHKIVKTIMKTASVDAP